MSDRWGQRGGKVVQRGRASLCTELYPVRYILRARIANRWQCFATPITPKGALLKPVRRVMFCQWTAARTRVRQVP